MFLTVKQAKRCKSGATPEEDQLKGLGRNKESGEGDRNEQCHQH